MHHSDARSTVLHLSNLGVSPTEADVTHANSISITPAEPFQLILAGSLPTSPQLNTISVPGFYWPDSATYARRATTEDYTWTSNVSAYTEDQLNAAPARGAYSFQRLHSGLPNRVHDLALEITSGHSTRYSKAMAIQQYLRETYKYSYAASQENTGPPLGRDPIDWFLFDQREGTSGNFSSAFVTMARSAGLAARVVSGWAIKPTSETQTVYADQAHQWAEVALGGLGWVTFDPTPDGAWSRAQPPLEPGSDEYLKRLGELVEDLSDENASVSERALWELRKLGRVSLLENGGAIVGDGKDVSWIVGTTTHQSPETPRVPLFNLAGTTHTNYLHVAVGDVYEHGSWRQRDPVSISPAGNTDIPRLVQSQLASETSELGRLPDSRRTSDLLAGFQTRPPRVYSDHLTVSPSGLLSEIPRGPVPTSLTLQTIVVEGHSCHSALRSSRTSP